MVAMGIYGKNTYLADSWNRLDFFIVFAGFFEYVVHVKNLNLTAIRTIRVLRPLRAINRIPSKLFIHWKEKKYFWQIISYMNFSLRYAYFGNVAVGYFAHAGQCLAVMFFCIFHIWHHRCTTLARYFKAKMCFRFTGIRKSAFKVSSFYIFQIQSSYFLKILT